MEFCLIIVFLVGLAVGSFLNVVIFRLDNQEKIVNDRSKCMNCKHVLAWHDLVPVLSFLYLRGRCRYCGKSISLQYPLVEMFTGALFVLVTDYVLKINGLTGYGSFFSFELPLSDWQFLSALFYYLFIICVLIVIFVYDLRHYIIPDEVIYPAIIVALVYGFVSNIFAGDNFQLSILNFQSISNSEFLVYNITNSIFLRNIAAAAAGGGFFLAVILATKGKGMGGGDLKLGILMGLVLGWPDIFLALFLSFILGSLAGLYLIAAGKKKMKSMIPFGPFLVIGTVAALFWGEEILRWYFGVLM